jgi:hypothetical protein
VNDGKKQGIRKNFELPKTDGTPLPTVAKLALAVNVHEIFGLSSIFFGGCQEFSRKECPQLLNVLDKECLQGF